MAVKVDFQLQLTEQNAEAASAVRTGETLQLQPSTSDSAPQVVNSAGQTLGTVPADLLYRVPHSAAALTVRSVRRQDGKVVEVALRYQAGPSPLQAPPGSCLPTLSCRSCLHTTSLLCVTADLHRGQENNCWAGSSPCRHCR